METKADFSRNSGEQLNQNVADTIKQSVGSEPIPPLDVKTRPTDPKHDDIAREHAKRDEKVADVRKDLANETAKASEKIAAAGEKEAEGIAKQRAKVDVADTKRDDAASKWRDAENELRYGYSVRSQYPGNSVWDESLESKLRGEWEALNTGMSWDASRTEIHRGWDYAGKTI